jgi:hypothetical protein
MKISRGFVACFVKKDHCMKTIFILKMKKSCGIKTDAGADDINGDIFTLPYMINLLLLTQESTLYLQKKQTYQIKLDKYLPLFHSLLKVNLGSVSVLRFD